MPGNICNKTYKVKNNNTQFFCSPLFCPFFFAKKILDAFTELNINIPNTNAEEEDQYHQQEYLLPEWIDITSFLDQATQGKFITFELSEIDQILTEHT